MTYLPGNKVTDINYPLRREPHRVHALKAEGPGLCKIWERCVENRLSCSPHCQELGKAAPPRIFAKPWRTPYCPYSGQFFFLLFPNLIMQPSVERKIKIWCGVGSHNYRLQPYLLLLIIQCLFRYVCNQYSLYMF